MSEAPSWWRHGHGSAAPAAWDAWRLGFWTALRTPGGVPPPLRPQTPRHSVWCGRQRVPRRPIPAPSNAQVLASPAVASTFDPDALYACLVLCMALSGAATVGLSRPRPSSPARMPACTLVGLVLNLQPHGCMPATACTQSVTVYTQPATACTQPATVCTGRLHRSRAQPRGAHRRPSARGLHREWRGVAHPGGEQSPHSN